MRRKKRKATQQERPKADDGVFNAGLHQGLETLKKARRRVPEPAAACFGETGSPPKAEPDDEAIFLEAMSDVKPLNQGRPQVIVSLPKEDVRPPHAPRNDDLEVMAHLSDLISGTADMDIRFSDEYMEGCVRGFDRKLMRRLRNGEFPVQDYVDLHGLTRQEAEVRLRDFLLRCYGQGLRCVLAVHGRGLNSEDGVPVLKRDLPKWLSRGPVRRILLAFSTARPYDGGTGAVYILLKRYHGVVRT